jgi:predicted metal-binding membrane protein
VTGEAVQRRAFYAGGLALAALGWAVLAVWAASPWGRYLGHGGIADTGLLSTICGADGSAALYVAGWVLMLGAMMLPTTLPVLWIFGRMTAQRWDRRRLMAALVAGYVAAWVAFGVLAHLGDAVVVAGVRRSVWLTFDGWALGAAVLALAGGFQFSGLKRRCLERCRSPLGLVMQHWRGARPMAEAWGLGLAHGVFCVGCCWALMLVMFVVGTGNVGWMLLLGLVMAAEKNLAWGRRLSAPVGLGLIGWSVAVVALHLPGLA